MIAQNFTLFIVAVIAFSQGVQHLADLSIQYLYKDEFHLSPAAMGLFVGISQIPWIIKPLWGILTDSYTIFGSKRKAYILMFGSLSGLGWLMMALYGENNMILTLVLLTSISSSVCVCNVVGEALMVEQSSNDHAANNVAIFFGFKATGGMISSYFSGYLLTYLTKSQIFLINSIFPFTMAILSLTLKEQNIRQSPSLSNTIKIFWSFFKNPFIYQPILVILAFMMSPGSSSIMFYFYTQELHFPPSFMGQLKFMYCIGSLLAIAIYKLYLKNVKFQTIFISTTILYFCCYLSTIILVTRKNVEWGINDKFFCLGDQVMLQFVGELNMLPILVYACNICPKDIEATIYAMLMAVTNFGSLMGGQIGNVILYSMGITETDFSKLWMFIAFTSVFLLFPIPWVHLIMEPKKEKVELEVEDEDKQVKCIDDQEREGLLHRQQ